MKKIDLLINDSDYPTGYEMRKYKTVASELSPQTNIIGDNPHCSGMLMNFTEQTNRDFLFFQGQPENHWYPGREIGIVYFRR